MARRLRIKIEVVSHGDGRSGPVDSMKRILAAAGISLLLISAAAFAVPSVSQVTRDMAQGNWQKADTELTEVLKAHPDNAHAHYLYGQVLAKEGRYADGLAQLEQAKTLDPQIRFADPTKFAQIESRLRTAAQGAGAQVPHPPSHGTAPNPFAGGPSAQTSVAAQPVVAPHHNKISLFAWLGIALVIIAIVLVLRWTLRRANSAGDARADEERRAQLKRATELLNTTRSLKLDARLSTAPGHESLPGDVEAVEGELRTLVEQLSNGATPVPAYRLDELAKTIDSLRARVDGRPDPNAATAGAAQPGGQSVFAQEAERLQQGAYGQQPGQPSYPPYPPAPQQPPVIIQQGGGGIGSGMGGLLTGVLLGEALSNNRERVIERDVYIDDERRNRRADSGGDAGGVDFGSGNDNWDDGSSGGSGDGDYGSNDSGGWNDN